MTYEEHLIKVYENLLNEKAENLVGKITDKVICHLKNVKDVSSFDRSELVLNNLWEDIALREQGYISKNEDEWYVCNDVIFDYIKSLLEEFDDADKKIIWLQTENANSTISSLEDYKDNAECIFAEYDINDVANYVFSNTMAEAVNYRNESIEKYIYGGEELD